MRVAIIHDWLVGMRGGEYVLEAICELFPAAPIYTLVAATDQLSPGLRSKKIVTSPLQKIPKIDRLYRHFLPVMPEMIERFDFSGYDLLISSSHCVAKGARKARGARHVSYVHAPMRYMWDRFDDYFGKGRASGPVRLAAHALRGRLQKWDRRVSQADRVDVLIANSRFIAGQIEIAYGREASVIYPFVNTSRFTASRKPSDRYLMVGAFAPNKRVDLAIEAFNQCELPLDIIGGGQGDERLRAMAGPSIRFLGVQSNDQIADAMARCRAFVFPGVEDFGITPLEAMAAGAPVIAFAAGGALETVTPETGIFFSPQTSDSLCAALHRLEDLCRVRSVEPMSEERCRKRAQEFSRERFKREFQSVIKSL